VFARNDICRYMVGYESYGRAPKVAGGGVADETIYPHSRLNLHLNTRQTHLHIVRFVVI